MSVLLKYACVCKFKKPDTLFSMKIRIRRGAGRTEGNSPYGEPKVLPDTQEPKLESYSLKATTDVQYHR